MRRLLNGGQLRRNDAGGWGVGKACDGDFIRNADLMLKQRLHKAEGQFVAGCENRIGQAAGEDLERRFITRVHAVFRRAQDTAAVRFKTGCALRPQQPLLHTGRDIGPVLVCQKPQAFSAKLQKMARHAIGAFLEIDVAGVKMRGRRAAFRKNKWQMRVHKARRAFRTERGGADNQAVEPLPDCRAQQFVLRAAARAAQVNGTIPPCGHTFHPKEQALYKIIAGVLGQQADRAGPRGGSACGGVVIVGAHHRKNMCARFRLDDLRAVDHT